MAVPIVNMVIEQGSDFTKTFNLKTSDGSPLDLSSYNFFVKMRKWSDSAGFISFATTYSGNPTLGNLTISLTNSQTGIITSGRYNYDVIIANIGISSTKTKVRTGQITVNPTVS